jgi:choline dehydrogenase
MQNHNPSGTVRLRSSDPREVPQIDFNFFEQGREIDLAALSEGLEHVTSIMNAMDEPYAPFTFIDPPSDRSLNQHILDHTFSHHALGSCRIGRDQTDSCVDSKFRVHGVEGLRVVDGSVFPRAPGGFPVGSTFLIGQKAFRVITEDA